MEMVQAQARGELAVVTVEGVEVATIGPEVEVEVEVAEGMARRVAEVAAEEEEARTPGAVEAVAVVEDFGHISCVAALDRVSFFPFLFSLVGVFPSLRQQVGGTTYRDGRRAF